MSWVDEEYYKAKIYRADDGKFPFYDIIQIGAERKSVAKILEKILEGLNGVSGDDAYSERDLKESITEIKRLVERLKE